MGAGDLAGRVAMDAHVPQCAQVGRLSV
ncbi:hypothetical protein MASSI9I_50149 [Massilia sp. 9I]|nr:hypothetical protein MASSI9I_50149 [Massilia sp. 9I]